MLKRMLKVKNQFFTKFHNFEIMFHISTLLPYQRHDEFKLARSRVIGNDITMIIFQEGNTTYIPETMTGDVNHVFLVVQPVIMTTGVKYRVGCVSKSYVKSFEPEIPGSLFEKGVPFREFILTKLINGHMAAQRSIGLVKMYSRPRLAKFKQIFEKYPAPKKITKFVQKKASEFMKIADTKAT